MTTQTQTTTQGVAPTATSPTTSSTPSTGGGSPSAVRSSLRQMSHAEGEAALRPPDPRTPGQAGQAAGPAQPFNPVRPQPGNEPPPGSFDPNDPNLLWTPTTPVQPMTGMGVTWGQDHASTYGTRNGPATAPAQAPPRQWQPGDPMTPVQPDPSQLQEGSHQAYGRGRTQADPVRPSDDLRGTLETARAARQRELDQMQQGQTAPGRRREQLQAEIHQLDQDITALRTGGAAHGQSEATAAIARRHGIDPGSLQQRITTHGSITTVTNSATAEGLGRQRTVAQQRDIPQGLHGAGGTVTETRTDSVALTRNGLSSGTGYSNTVEHPNGATHTGHSNYEHSVGISNGGVGYQHQHTYGERAREADGRRQDTEHQDTRHAVITQNGVQAGTQNRYTTTGTAADGTSNQMRDTSGTTGNVSFGADGRLSGVSATRSREQRIEHRDAPRDGEEQGAVNRTQTRTGSIGGGFVRDQTTGTGAQVNFAGSQSQADRENARSSSVTGSATVTDRQVGGNVQGTGARNVGPVRVGGTFGVGGFYRIVAEPVRDTSPQMYDLVTTLQYEVTVGGSVGNNSDRVQTPAQGATEANGFRSGMQRSGAVSIGAERRVRRTNTFRHRMTQAQLEAYRVMAERSAASENAPGGSPPEFGLITRINAARQQRRTPSDRELAGDPAIAASLGEGSSIENTQEIRDTGNASARGNAGVLSGGVSVSRTHTGTVTRRSGERRVDGVLMVEVTLTFRDETETTGSVHAAVDQMGGTIARTQNEQQGRTVVLLMNPQDARYRAQYAEAYAVETMAQAEALAARTRSQITRSQQRSHTTSGGVGTMDNGAVSTGITASERRQTGSEITVGRAGANGQRTLSGTTTGESESQMGVNVRGTRVLGATETTSATNTVGADGSQQVTVNNTQTGGVQTPAFLQQLWRTTYTRMQSYDLDEADIHVLVGRAGNRDGWFSCLSGRELLHIQGPWGALRNRLLSPSPPREWRDADPTIADKIARGQAITDFIGSVGASHGLAAMRGIMREYNPAHPLGVHWEWPDALRTQQTQWTTLHAEVRGAAARFTSMPAEGRTERVQVEVTRIRGGLQAIQRAIEGCNTFEDSSARPEMLEAIDRDIRDLERAQRRAARASAPAHANAAASGGQAGQGGQQPTQASAPPPAQATAQTPPPAQAQQAAPNNPQQAQVDTEAERQAEQRQENEASLASAIRTLQRYQREEAGHWRASQAHVQTARGRWLTSTADDVRAAIDQLVAIEVDWVGRWGAAWRQAVGYARELGRPGDVPRNLRTNWDWRARLLREAVAVASESTRGHYDVEGRINRWRSQDRD